MGEIMGSDMGVKSQDGRI